MSDSTRKAGLLKRAALLGGLAVFCFGFDGGCGCSAPLTPSPMANPAPAAAKLSPMINHWELDWPFNLWGKAEYAFASGIGCTLAPSPWLRSPGGSPETPGYAMHIAGTMQNSGTIYFASELTDGGKNQVAGVNLTSQGWTMLTFYAKSDAPSATYRIRLLSAYDGQYFYTNLPVLSSTWTQYTVKFTSLGSDGTTAGLGTAAYSLAKALTEIGAVRFDIKPVAGPVAYDLWIDDLGFQ